MMKTKYAVLAVFAGMILITCVSGCVSTNPSSGPNSSTTSGVPVYQPSVKTASVSTSLGTATTYETVSPTSQVADFYQTQMANNGYALLSSHQASGDYVLSFTKGSSSVRIAIASVQAQIGPLNLSQFGATTFVVTESGT
jgi:hypothetical protein